SSSRSTAPGSGRASEFRMRSESPHAASAARFTPAAKPRFVSQQMSCTEANCAAMAPALPSREALSTTIVSNPATESIASSVNAHVLKETIRKETLNSGNDNADQARASTVDRHVLLDQARGKDQLILLVEHRDTAVDGGLLAGLQVAAEAPAIRVGGAGEIGA